jgi:formylglycine-generating enzyme required for sulfatase activity
VGATVSYLKYLDAQEQRRIAEEREKQALREADKANKTSDYLLSIFALADARGPRGAVTARQILDEAEKSIPQKFGDEPELREKMLKQIGATYDTITEDAPLAMILEVSGAVRLQSTRDPNQRAVPQTLLYTADRLSLGADGHVRIVVLSDLHQERLRPGTEATIRRRGCEPVAAIGERDDAVLMTFVRLPKGTFYAGGGGGRAGKKAEIKEDFEIAVHPVTQGQWQAVMGNNPSFFARGQDVSDEERKLFPVDNVSWNDAQEFITKLNEKERGRGWWYRLPTEAEWEYACRGGATSEEECSYHFYFDKPTNNLSLGQANFNGHATSLIVGGEAPPTMLARPSRVGAYPPNKLGLCDMHGNVGQWCTDRDARLGEERVVRGGSWGGPASSCRAGARNSFPPSDRGADKGFRLVRVPAGHQG